MNKVPLSDGSGHWFDKDSATVWLERVSSEEQQHREHHGPYEEKLYLTKGGSFVLYTDHWRMGEIFLLVDTERAAKWLIANGYQGNLAQLELQAEERRLEI